MVDPIKNIEIFASGRKALSSLIGLKPEDKLDDKATEINVSDELGEDEYKIKPSINKDDLQELSLGRKLYQSVVDALIRQKDKGLKHGEDYIIEDTDRYPCFSDYEQSIHDALIKAIGILRRIYNRKTGFFSWGLLGVLKFIGFKDLKGNFEEFEKEIIRDPEFAQKFSKYYSEVQKNGKEAGNLLLLEIYEGDKIKQNLAKLLLTTINISNKLSKSFVQLFPVSFSVQNIVMPWLSWLFPKGIIGKFFNFIRIVNPWVDEFINTHTALSGDEINSVNDITRSLAKQSHVQSEQIGDKDEPVIGKITLADSDVQKHELKRILDSLNAGVKRLFGRQRNASSWLVTLILNSCGFKDYEDFEKKVIEKPEILNELHKHLSEKKHASLAEVFDLKDKFSNPVERNVATGILAILSITKNINKKYIESVPKYFGLPYSVLYLTLPIIHSFIGEKSFFGKCIGFVQRVSPLVNDLAVDIVASAFEETTLIKDAMNKNSSLFKKLPTGSGVLKESYGALKEAFSKLKNRLPNFGMKTAKGTT